MLLCLPCLFLYFFYLFVCQGEDIYTVHAVSLTDQRPIFSIKLFTVIEVNCCAVVCGKPEGPALIRHLILCWSGDHIGLCEIGKFIIMGKCGFRRCRVASEKYNSLLLNNLRNMKHQ